MSIAAVVDGRDGKNIELVQHTPKRDKGPQEKPPRVSLSPKPPPSMGGYGANSSLSRGLYDQSYSPNSQSTTEANFERIQFKNATANNGKRRAAQQYYHIVVELYADVGNQHPDQWIKVASRISAPMVVRGRSPGHYQGERRGSNASTGPGGSGGSGGAGSYTPSNTSRNGDMNISGSSILPAAGYNNSYEGRNHHYRPPIPPSQVPMEPTLSHEDAKGIEEAPGYVYYPGAIWEGYEGHNHLPSMGEHNMNKIKQEYNSNSNGYVLPSLTNIQEGFGRHCGRWDGAPESKGYFPTAFVQQTMNIS
jgi:meiosis-specific transcription factor NDT80